MVIKRRCSTTADCETFPCYSKEFKKICIDNLCECKIPNSDGSAQTTENERPCSSQKCLYQNEQPMNVEHVG
ncbi:unnamed protein product [Prunus armeniaca]|uniref:Uncharacterized protein n=1 Tax=Prunus armeniaca TaxID=36596 RepID=A0A6J5UR81_PRUAR|nr:unnamed protein product [Prunus armeniaca]CAB4309424.1 unnamed protein product [Prunus armeniaca]